MKPSKVTPPPLPTRKRFPWLIYWIVLALIAVVAFAPIGSVITCAWIANAHGCKVDEGSVHPCIINGKDYGQMLYTMGVLGWLMLVTLPGGALAFALWLVCSCYIERTGEKRRFQPDRLTLGDRKLCDRKPATRLPGWGLRKWSSLTADTFIRLARRSAAIGLQERYPFQCVGAPERRNAYREGDSYHGENEEDYEQGRSAGECAKRIR